MLYLLHEYVQHPIELTKGLLQACKSQRILGEIRTDMMCDFVVGRQMLREGDHESPLLQMTSYAGNLDGARLLLPT